MLHKTVERRKQPENHQYYACLVISLPLNVFNFRDTLHFLVHVQIHAIVIYNFSFWTILQQEGHHHAQILRLETVARAANHFHLSTTLSRCLLQMAFFFCNYPRSTTIHVHVFFWAGCAWQTRSCITETNTDTVINKLCICWRFYSGPPAPHSQEWRCAVYTNCLFSWTALNLIRPQTLMPNSPVEHNGLSNAMNSVSLPARPPICIRLNGVKAVQNGLADVMAFVVASAGF